MNYRRPSSLVVGVTLSTFAALLAVGCTMDRQGLQVAVTGDGGLGGTGGGIVIPGVGGNGGQGQGGNAGGVGGTLVEDAGAGGQVAVDAPPDQPPPAPGVNGAACEQGSECASGHCVDGLCCESACDGVCSACSQERTGSDDGVCAAVRTGTDPDDECEAGEAGTCGQTGECGGGRACALAPATRTCGESACVGQTLTPAPRCDGAGACKPRPSSACPGGLRCENATSCRDGCTSDNQCTPGNYCDLEEGECRPGKALGATCDAGEAGGGGCASGFCVDGVCCESACTGSCNACSQGRTGAANGKCAPVRAGTDPDNECRRDEPSSCGQDGTCNGAGACRAYADGTACGSTCCDRGPGRGSRPCSFSCRAGRCDTTNPTPGDACGGLACCCPNGGGGGGATCSAGSIFGCPAGCQR